MSAAKRKRECDSERDCDSQESTANNMYHSGSIEDVDAEELLRQMSLIKFAIHPSTQFKGWDNEAMWCQIIEDMREKNGRNPPLITVLETVMRCHDSYTSHPSMSSDLAKLLFGKEDMGFDIECIEKMLGCRGKQMTGGKRKKEISENNSASVSTATDICSFDFSITELWMLLEKLKRAVSANKIGYETCRVKKDVAGEAIKNLESAYRLAERSIFIALSSQMEAGAAKREVEAMARTLSYLNSIDKITAEEMAVAAHIFKNDRSAACAFLQVMQQDAQVKHIKKMINKWNPPPQRFA